LATVPKLCSIHVRMINVPGHMTLCNWCKSGYSCTSCDMHWTNHVHII